MGFWDTITDMAEAVAPWSVAQAEAPPAEEKTEEKADAPETSKDGEDASAKEESEDKDESEAKSEDKEEESGEEEAEAEGEEEEEDEEEEDEDEEDDEPKDPKEELEEQCKESKQCHPAKHHYDECVERVTAQEEKEGGAKEDCVEEFFHLAHCATQCAAPKLWSKLK